MLKTVDLLWQLAVDRHGFVTTREATAAGVAPTELVKLAHRGRLERPVHGVYRVPYVPVGPLDDYMLATLWPAGRGVISHETALQLHDLCDIEPERIHITVPPGYRPRRHGGELYVIHHEHLGAEDLTWHEGIRIVTPARAIEQAIETHVAPHLVGQAIETARQRGALTPYQLERLERLRRGQRP
jgi:predicted transcriptional regulator of viral defense system